MRAWVIRHCPSRRNAQGARKSIVGLCSAPQDNTSYMVVSAPVVVKTSQSVKLTDVQRRNVLYLSVKKLQVPHSLRKPTDRKGEERFLKIDCVMQLSSQTGRC
jgi:hypothetical protein